MCYPSLQLRSEVPVGKKEVMKSAQIEAKRVSRQHQVTTQSNHKEERITKGLMSQPMAGFLRKGQK